MTDLTPTVGILNFSLNEGTDFDMTLTWKDSVTTPVDVSSYTAMLQVRPTADHVGSATIELSVGSGITLGGSEGTILIEIGKTLNVLGRDRYVYDLEMTDVNDKTKRLIAGTITSIEEVTK